MKKIIKALILPLVVVSGLLFANCETKNETKTSSNNLSMVKKKSSLEERKKWEASPDGIMFKKWKVSPEGKKIKASHDKIRNYLKNFSEMEAIITSVTFQRENTQSSGPKWLIVTFNGEEYMMQFSIKDFQKLNSLKVDDKIIVKSQNASYSPNHPYLILSSDYIAKDNKVLFKRDLSKNKGC